MELFAVEEMAGNEDEGESLVNKISGSLEKAQDCAARENETRKQKKAGSSREKKETPRNKPSSSKTTMTLSKGSRLQSRRGFRQLSTSLSTEIAGVLSSTAHIPSKRPRKELSDSDSA